MLRIGLTGGIACGKTVVRKRLEERGIRALDADTVVHRILATDGEAIGEIVKEFGDSVAAPDGTIDRKALGALVFSDPTARERLNGIVHPRVYREIEGFFAKAAESGEPLAVVDAALMIETGSFRKYDRVIVVHCRRDQQCSRLMARSGLSAEDAERRIAAQMPIEEKRAYGDFLVDTSGTLEETLARTDSLAEELHRLAN
jgi:dephospho-CoA kinase